MNRKRGLVLILVLIVVSMLSLASYAYVELMRSHREATMLAGRQLQTKMMIDSGVEYVRSFLAQTSSLQLEAGGHYNNPDRFRQVVMVPNADPLQRGCFTVVAPALDDQGNLAGIRYGLEDESTRLNLNTLLVLEKQQQGVARQLLMALPQMTEDVADAILDYMDADEETREFGAESDYYSSLEPPYFPKNGPLDTVEELLRLRGVTPLLLFGRDVNRNGQIDPAEALTELPTATTGSTSSATTTPPTNGLLSTETGISSEENTGSLDRGWSAYLTLYSREKNLNPDGQPRIFLNQPDLKKLYEELSEVFPPDWVTFIVAYRQGTPSTNNARASRGVSKSIDFNKPARTNLTQVLDLLGANTQVTFAGEATSTTLASPFTTELGAMNVYLPTLLDHVTVNPADTIPGRINVLQASATLLRGIPGIDATIVENILSVREAEMANGEDPNYRHETWLLTKGVVTLEQMKLLQPFLNCGGQVYRAQVVGYYQHGEASARGEAVFEATGLVPRILLWRDMTHLGRGYALETLGLDYSE
jgi:hypothetical protein